MPLKFLIFTFYISFAVCVDPPKATTKLGPIEGQTVTSEEPTYTVEEYLGIPFAKPPTGKLRFARPQPITESWTTPLSATKLPNSPLQMLDTTFADFKGSEQWNSPTERSEDCLYLNVWVPSPRPAEKLAVLVWIFGGGFYSGTSTLEMYDGKLLAANNNIIVVSMNYRLAALGFATLNSKEMPANNGLWDQLMALTWVQDNIEAFGGNPKEVTIMGESAGAASVHYHLLSPLSQPKFARAIMQSSTATAPWAYSNKENARNRTLLLAKNNKCFTGDETDTQIAECLRDKPSSIYNDGMDWITDGHAQFPFIPTADGELVLDDPEKLMMQPAKYMKNCPILLGTNRDEGTFFLMYHIMDYAEVHDDKSRSYPKAQIKESDQFGITDSDLKYWLADISKYYPDWPVKTSQQALKAILYEYENWRNDEDIDNCNKLANGNVPNECQENAMSLAKAAGDFNFVCDVMKFSEWHILDGQKTYLYHFTQRATNHPWAKWMGVLHGDEIMFTFGNPLYPKNGYSENEKMLSSNIMKYWTTFAKTGSPNTANQEFVQWPASERGSMKRLELNDKYIAQKETAKKAIQPTDSAKECAFWKHYIPEVEQDALTRCGPAQSPQYAGAASSTIASLVPLFPAVALLFN